MAVAEWPNTATGAWLVKSDWVEPEHLGGVPLCNRWHIWRVERNHGNFHETSTRVFQCMICGLPRAGHIVILCGIGVVALLWLMIRFSRQIGRALLIAGVVVLVDIVAVSGLASLLASLQTARTAQTAIRATSITSGLAGIVIGGLAVISLGAACIAGFFYLRWKLEQRRKQLPRQQPKALPSQEAEIVYARPCGRVVEDDVDLSEVDLSQWGW